MIFVGVVKSEITAAEYSETMDYLLQCHFLSIQFSFILVPICLSQKHWHIIIPKIIKYFCENLKNF